MRKRPGAIGIELGFQNHQYTRIEGKCIWQTGILTLLIEALTRNFRVEGRPILVLQVHSIHGFSSNAEYIIRASIKSNQSVNGLTPTEQASAPGEGNWTLSQLFVTLITRKTTNIW